MRILFFAALLVGLAGCGSDSEPITDPSQLPPLTEEQKLEIQKNDSLIEDEERTGGGMIAP